MESFVVSARKYRPQQFSEVIGQESLTSTLRRAIETGKLAGAYLFCGPRGVGKTTCARIFAKTINCLNPPRPGEACEECESCRSFNEQRSVNVQELNASANNSVDDIRAIIDQVRIPPQLGKYKVIILDEVHMLSASASNALLKTLEEPPSYVIFILATTEKQKILPTILSRCQIFDFNRMTVGDIVKELRLVAEGEGISYEESALNLVAQKADGGMRDALSIFDQLSNYSGGNITRQAALESLNVLDYDYYFRMVDHLRQYRVSEALLLLGEIINKGFDAGQFIGGLAGHLRDLLVSRDPETLPLLDVGSDLQQRYGEQAALLQPAYLYRAMHICDDCSNGYRNSFNKRLSVELALIDVAQLTQGVEVKPAQAPQPLKPLLRDTNPPAQKKAATPQSIQAEQKPQPKPQPQPAEPQQKPIPRIPRINLGNLGRMGGTPAAKPDKEEAPKKQDEPPAPAALTRETLEKEWTAYVEKEVADESARKRLAFAETEVDDDMSVNIGVPSSAVADFIRADVRRLEQHLVKTFGDNRLRLNIEIRLTERDNEPHTPGEIFADMLSRSEPLRTLRTQLGLELE